MSRRYSQKIAWGTNGSWYQLENLFVPGWGMAPSEKAFVFVDNHDNQRSYGRISNDKNDRFMYHIQKSTTYVLCSYMCAGGKGDTLIYKNVKEYTWATAYTLAFNYGFTRIMSSYEFDDTDSGKQEGPPHLDDDDYT